VAVWRMSFKTESGTGSVLKSRMERRERRNVCRSVVWVKAGGLDLKDNARLSFAKFPRRVVVFEGELVDVFVPAFGCVAGYFAANAEVALFVVGILNGHGHFGTCAHVFILDASFCGVDQNIFPI